MKFSAVLLAAAALQACGSESKASNAFQESFNNSFRSSFASSFVASCKTAGIAKGAPADAMEQLCGCTADDLLSKYDKSELAGLSTSPEKAQPSADACKQKLGFTPKPNAATGAP